MPSMQSLSEDSMICWAADYFRKQWEDLVESRKTASLKDESLPRFLILSGLDEAMYYWWNSDKEKTQEVCNDKRPMPTRWRARTGKPTALQKTAAEIVKKRSTQVCGPQFCELYAFFAFLPICTAFNTKRFVYLN